MDQISFFFLERFLNVTFVNVNLAQKKSDATVHHFLCVVIFSALLLMFIFFFLDIFISPVCTFLVL